MSKCKHIWIQKIETNGHAAYNMYHGFEFYCQKCLIAIFKYLDKYEKEEFKNEVE